MTGNTAGIGGGVCTVLVSANCGWVLATGNDSAGSTAGGANAGNGVSIVLASVCLGGTLATGNGSAGSTVGGANAGNADGRVSVLLTSARLGWFSSIGNGSAMAGASGAVGATLIATSFEQSEALAVICGNVAGKETTSDGVLGSNGLTAISTGVSTEIASTGTEGGVSPLTGANDNTSGVVAVLNRRLLWATLVRSSSGVACTACTDGGSECKFVATKECSDGVNPDSDASRRVITADGERNISTSLTVKSLAVLATSVLSAVSRVRRATILPCCGSVVSGSSFDCLEKSFWSVRGILRTPTAEWAGNAAISRVSAPESIQSGLFA